MTAIGKKSGLVERMRVVTKLMLALLLVATMTVYVPSSPPQAYAANGAVGTIAVDGKTTEYATYPELAHALEGIGAKNVTIEMARDWRKIETNTFPRLVVPTGANVTLNMNGHKIDKLGVDPNPAGAQNDGEVILVMNGATLTINGGSSDVAHSASYYTSTEQNRAPETKQISGGLITGGSSTNGTGGINVREGATVTLNDVTIAGCRARAYNGANGNGGGMYVGGGNVTINMNNSSIEGCYAGEDGGAIYVPEDCNAKINLVGSHIDNNRAYWAGGAITVLGKGTMILGDEFERSTISGNVCNVNGGGIKTYAGGFWLSEVNMERNKAHRGGALHIGHDPFALEGLIIEDNEAVSGDGGTGAGGQGVGGGIYVYNSTSGDAAEPFESMGCSVIRDCTVEGNKAEKYGGIYFNDQVSSVPKKWERKLQGIMIVRDNTAAASDWSNLCIETENGPEDNDWVRKSETFNLTADSEVWVGFATLNTASAATEHFIDSNCASCLRSDAPAYEFQYVTYGEEDSEDAVPLVNRVPKSDSFTRTTITYSDANDASRKDNGAKTVAGKVGTVGAGGEAGSDFDLIRGFYMHDNETNLAAFYYSDGLFYGDPYTYNTHLATASWNLAFVGGYLNQAKPAWDDGNVYYNKHAAARQFFADIGCPDESIYVNDSMLEQPGDFTIGVSMASKELRRASTVKDGKLVPGEETGDILIPVTVRGLGYETEWISNVTIGYAAEVPGAEAKGFADAADEVVGEIEYYLQKYGLEEAFKEGRVKFWVTGFSRAGATANLVSKRLVDKIEAECTGEAKSQVFGYPCEAPKGGTDLADEGLKNNDNRYFCIHNMINKVDIVPYVAPEEMGFKRYGVDHFIPGGPAGSVNATVKQVACSGEGGPTQVTTYADNDAWLTKTTNYNNQKVRMLEQLKTLDPGMTFNDFFVPMAMDFIHTESNNGWWPSDVSFLKTYRNGSASNQVEYFSADLMRLLQEGVYPNDSDPYGVGKAAGSRDVYARDAFMLQGTAYPSIQTAAAAAMKLIMADDSGFMDKAGNIKGVIPYFDLSLNNFASIYLDLIGKWHKIGDSWRKKHSIESLWGSLEKTGALDGLSAGDRQEFENAFPTLVNVAFNFVDADYLHHPKDNREGYQWAIGSTETMMTLPTLMTYSSYIIGCHLPQINIAWTRTYDSWYTDNPEFSEYALAQPGWVAPPKAYGSTVAGEQVELKSATNYNYNNLTGEQTIVLDNPEMVGEAIYYDLVDENNSKNSVSNQLYRGGIDLSLHGGKSASYMIRAYTYSYGVRSDTVIYYVKLGANSHKVYVRDLAPDGEGGSASALSATSATDDVRGTSAATAVSSSDEDGLTLVPGSTSITAVGSDSLSTAASGGTHTQTFAYEEGVDVFIQASEPASRYFTGWEAQVIPDYYNPDWDAGADVTGSLPWKAEGGASKAATSFTMPTVSETFPENYQLVLTAQYGSRTSSMSVALGAPKKGQSLSTSAKVKFPGDSTTYEYPVTWAYTYYDNGVAKTVPASGAVFRNTDYTATITVPQDMAKGIMFMPKVNVRVRDDVSQYEEAYVWEGTIARNAADGSITFTVPFSTTGSDAGEDKPQATASFDVVAFDANANTQDLVATYSVNPGDVVSITAPDIPGKMFAGWYLGEEPEGSSIKFAGGSKETDKTVTLSIPNPLPASPVQIQAQYLPVVQRVDVNFYTYGRKPFVLGGGKSKPSLWDMTIVTAGGEYEVASRCLKVVWSPEPKSGRFANLVEYTATVELVPDVQGKVLWRKKGETGAFQEINRLLVPSQDVKVVFNGNEEGTFYGVTDDAPSVGKTYPRTDYVLSKVKQPGNIEGLAYGTGAEDISALLPATTKVMVNDGREFDAAIEWETPTIAAGAEDAYAACTWTAEGAVQLPEGVGNPGGAVSSSVSLTASVDAAQTAAMPSMSLPDGTYLYDQWGTLATTESSPGATTYYTMSRFGEDGSLAISDPSDPDNPDRRKLDDGETLFISRLAAVPTTVESFDAEDNPVDVPVKSIVVQAYTEAPGKRPSAVATYEYQFRDIPAPEGQDSEYDGTEHIGVQASPYYELSLDPAAGDNQNARIDEYGNVVATVPGTYRVTADLLLSNDYWAAEGKNTRSQGAKTVEFTIGPMDLPDTVVNRLDIDVNSDEGGKVSGAGTYVDDMGVTAKAWANEGYEFVNWTVKGKVVSTEPVYTFPIVDDMTMRANFARVLTVQWLDADGNLVDSKTYLEGDEEPTTEAKPAKASDAQYSYTFEGWDLAEDDGVVKTYKPRYASSPAKKASLTFDYAGGTLDGKASLVIVAGVGDTVTMPAAPTRDGYAFKCWKDPELSPGDRYKVEGDHAFTAVWEQEPAPGADLAAFEGAAAKAGFTDLDDGAWYMSEGLGDGHGGVACTYLDYVVGRGLMSGYSGTTLFGPDDTLSRGMAATIIYRMATGETARTTDNNVGTKFSDVPAGRWYSAAVAWCAEEGVVTGYAGSALFGPDDDVTREQLATMICRYCVKAGGQAPGGADLSRFSDERRIAGWAREGVAHCVANGIVSGYSDGSNRFGPQDTATRCQMAKIIAVTAILFE